MVYPVSGAPQQIPAANTFQPGGTEATKTPEENKTIDATRPSGTDAARSEKSDNRLKDRDRTAANDRSSQDTGSIRASSSRGTQLDITA